MSLMYTYGTGSSASSDRYSTIDELLIQLPDNTGNLIDASDVRDSIFTLWERVSDVGIIAASAASASAYFQNPDPTPITVGGIIAGSTFPIPTDMQTMWNQLLYPYVGPNASISISGGGSTREYGQTIGLLPNSIVLNWSVTKNSDPIIIITVDGLPQVPTGVSQIGTKSTNGTHSVSPGSSETNTFSMSVNDGTTTTNASTVLTWMNRLYWGKIDLTSIGDPNLTTNPGSASMISSLVTDTFIVNNLTGAGVGSGNQLSSTKTKTYNGINGGGDHLIFAWPSSVSGALTPVFTVNGLPSTAFTRIRTSSALSNTYGFITNYEVWVSNTLQNSPISLFSIT